MPPEAHPSPTIAPHELGFGRLFDAIRDGVIVSDEEGRIVLWNPGAEALFGYTAEEALGQNVSLLVPPEHQEQHESGMRRYAATGQGRLIDSGTVLELPALRKDGNRIHVELTLSPIEENGQRYVLALLRDVTERVRLQQEVAARSHRLQEALEALRDSNEALEAFSFVVSHDLKEPARAVEAYLRAIREDYGAVLPPEGTQLLTQAERATGHLQQLLRGLLDLSRLSRAELHPEPCKVNEVLDNAVCRAAYGQLLTERNAQLHVDPDIPPVQATFSVLCQVFGNLVTNAIR
ncbi:MAG TPA: PAS domain S-box protein, partial [Candidatus Thermoplasmatota archaeon]|nr:PAS domain S-box protein [Candidatus Thermoplasmatota archaeon]